MNPVLSLSQISYNYHTLQGETAAIKEISFQVAKGEFIAIVGPSGCGKSTLLHIIAGLLFPSKGTILMKGLPLSESKSEIGYMLQKDHLLEHRTIYKNILLGLFISIYILSSKERLYAVTTKAARAFMTAKVFNNCMRYVRIASSTFGRFFIGKLFDSTIVFIITLALLSVFGIPHATFIAMIVGVLNIIHFFGIIIAIVLSAFIVLIAAPSKLLLFLLIMIVIQQIESNVIAPKILGSSAGISSLGVIAAVIIMGSCFGIIGMIIGVPIFAIIIAIFKDYLDNKLAKKNLPVNTSNYYTDHDYSSENEEYKPLTKLLLDPVFKKISKRLNVAISHDLKKDDITEEDTNYDDEVTSDDSNIEENTEENK